jgi:hypothetical protein
MSETMDVTIATRRIAYVALAGVLLAAGIAFNDRRYPATPAWKTEFSPSKAIGAEAANDSTCKAVWDANRTCFSEPGILYQDRVTGIAPSAPAETAGQPQ